MSDADNPLLNPYFRAWAQKHSRGPEDLDERTPTRDGAAVAQAERPRHGRTRKCGAHAECEGRHGAC